MRSLLVLLAALLVAGPALADNRIERHCQSFLGLAATDDNTPLTITPKGGATAVRIGCFVNADVATPATISIEDAAGNATTGTATCAEAGADVVFAIPSTGRYFQEDEAILFDIDNAATTGDYIVCVDLKVRQ